MDNFLKGNNIEIQCVAVSENENQEDLEKVTMAILKIVDLNIFRQQIGDIKRLRPTKPNANHKKNYGKKILNPMLVKVKSKQ